MIAEVKIPINFFILILWHLRADSDESSVYSFSLHLYCTRFRTTVRQHNSQESEAQFGRFSRVSHID